MGSSAHLAIYADRSRSPAAAPITPRGRALPEPARDLLEGILMVVLKAVSAEQQQEGYVGQLEALADTRRDRLGRL
ncbi:hypothetical protein OG806_00900 [Streptomyces sp. NBC_00882]|uniref:hypothetical protein n=1 Tax=Streptomyces TaxID=1883 RepID=UPI00386A6698|nr:hypothetical protein OG806_00900 [Streptomyces sp. NBC_00882]WSZ55141.1 hypothetical protein OH824_00490 [Streptomyces canus]